MSPNKFSSVEDYLNSLDPPKGVTLGEVIDFILKRFPDLHCKLAWNVPQICRGDDYVFGVSALKNHLALAPWSAGVKRNKTRYVALDSSLKSSHIDFIRLRSPKAAKAFIERAGV